MRVRINFGREEEESIKTKSMENIESECRTEPSSGGMRYRVLSILDKRVQDWRMRSMETQSTIRLGISAQIKDVKNRTQETGKTELEQTQQQDEDMDTDLVYDKKGLNAETNNMSTHVFSFLGLCFLVVSILFWPLLWCWFACSLSLSSIVPSP